MMMLRSMMSLSGIKSGIRRSMSTTTAADRLSPYSSFTDLSVTCPSDRVLHVQLNRPSVRNALSTSTFSQLTSCFQEIDKDRHFRTVILSGSGKIFCSGIDIRSLLEMSSQTEAGDPARRAQLLYQVIPFFQQPIIAINNCKKPVIAAIQGACIGGGIDLISACDLRFTCDHTYFSIREVDLGLAADMGTLQLLPKIVGNDGLMRELVFTGRNFDTDEAKDLCLVNKVLPNEEQLMHHVVQVAQTIASKSPIAVQGSKVNLNYSRDHSVDDGLKFMAAWNASMLQAEDVPAAGMALATKSPVPEFPDI